MGSGAPGTRKEAGWIRTSIGPGVVLFRHVALRNRGSERDHLIGYNSNEFRNNFILLYESARDRCF